jgi:heat shock protein HslJ
MNREARVATGAWTTAILLCGAVLASRSGEAAAATESPLAGTQWRLVEIRSMDDAIGTVRPHDPSRYTMRLNADGTANLRLDCNRAKSTWSAEASADRSSGRFQFGPLAATRALRPPPRLDERVAKDAGFIRSYLLKDGRLYLSLMADGGIYAWEPDSQEEPFQTKPDADLEAAILRASPDYTRAGVDAVGGTGGCNLMLFSQGRDGYSLVNEFPISRLPVIVSADETAGWHDLFRLESGGGAPASYVRHAFDGQRYVEQERTPAHKAPAGRSCLAGELSFDKGIPLEPR